MEDTIPTPQTSPTPLTSRIALTTIIVLLLSSLSLSAFLFYQNRELQKQIAKLSTPQNKIFCGGIAGVICPAGYTCQYTDNYPDASGTCVKEPSLRQP